jgi:hypothetical protein
LSHRFHNLSHGILREKIIVAVMIDDPALMAPSQMPAGEGIHIIPLEVSHRFAGIQEEMNIIFAVNDR